MHNKNIKRIVQKELKKNYPNWNRLNRKTKKEISRKVLAQVVGEYDFNQEISASLDELLGVEQQVPTKGIISLDQMADIVNESKNNNIIKLCGPSRFAKYIKNEELRFIDQLLDNEIINHLLAYEGYRPAMRELFPHNLFRAELLKTIKYPEISYRKFCDEEYLGLDRKQNRAFIGLSLREKTMIDHTQLSKFRNSLTFVQQINITVYILYHFLQSGMLGDHILHGVDSSELANECKFPLASLNVNGQNIRIYSDLDSDCGKRRNKRDKSVYVIGYRLHTLTAINAETGHSFPIISLLAPANHHDSHFLSLLVDVAQAMGVEVKLVTADTAYHDNDGSLYDKTGVYVTTPPCSTVSTPDNVDTTNGTVVFCHDGCTVPMEYAGVEEDNHEYKCSANTGECLLEGSCPKYRCIPLDRGFFQRIPYHVEQIQEAHDIRKNCERPFNLLKHQTGLENVRVRSQSAIAVRCTFSSISLLLLKIAGTRKKESAQKSPQLSLFKMAA